LHANKALALLHRISLRWRRCRRRALDSGLHGFLGAGKPHAWQGFLPAGGWKIKQYCATTATPEGVRWRYPAFRGL